MPRATLSSNMTQKLKAKRACKEAAVGYLFIAGFLLCYLIFTLYPMLDAFVISFFHWDIVNPRVFAGFSNYETVLGDSEFWAALWHTIEFLLISTIPLMLGSFLLAVLVFGYKRRANWTHKGVYSVYIRNSI